MHNDRIGYIHRVELMRHANGKYRAKEELGELQSSDRKDAYQRIGLLEGLRIGSDTKNVKHIRGKLWEYKFNIKSGSYRAFFYIDATQTAVIIPVLQKKKQKFSERILRDIEALIPD